MEEFKDPLPYKILEVYLRQDTGFGISGPWKDKPCWFASVETKSAIGNLSRHMDECGWYFDAMFRTTTYVPIFCHGFGNRSVLKQEAPYELRVLLDAAADKWVKEHGTEPIQKHQ